MSHPDVLAITDPSLSDDVLAAKVSDVLRNVPRSSVGVQLRDKVRGSRALHVLAARLVALCREFAAPFYVNDRLDVAIAVGADGVHLGGASLDVADARQLLGPSAFVSVAAHELAEVERASLVGASAAIVSPIFETPGKGPARGTALLAAARACAGGVRIYALGGIDASRVAPCIAAGADGVAVVRALWNAADPARAAFELVAAVRNRASTTGSVL